jgi:hypothetical protein
MYSHRWSGWALAKQADLTIRIWEERFESSDKLSFLDGLRLGCIKLREEPIARALANQRRGKKITHTIESA